MKLKLFKTKKQVIVEARTEIEAAQHQATRDRLTEEKYPACPYCIEFASILNKSLAEVNKYIDEAVDLYDPSKRPKEHRLNPCQLSIESNLELAKSKIDRANKYIEGYICGYCENQFYRDLSQLPEKRPRISVINCTRVDLPNYKASAS